MVDLKLVYTAPDEDIAQEKFECFKDKWDSKYPKIYKSWHDNWATLSTYFKYPEAVRRLIYRKIFTHLFCVHIQILERFQVYNSLFFFLYTLF